MTFDVALNVCSMQEMTPTAVEIYFAFLRNHLRPDNVFLCVNRADKTLPGGERSVFADYPWLPGDHHLLDGYQAWRNGVGVWPGRYGTTTLRGWRHIRSARKKPIWMRLTRMATRSDVRDADVAAGQ